jgi:O-antigen ligase
MPDPRSSRFRNVPHAPAFDSISPMQAEASMPQVQSGPSSVRAYSVAAGLLLASTAFSFNFTSFMHPKEAILCIFLALLAALSIRKSIGTDGFMVFAPLWMFLGQSVMFRLALFPAKVPADLIEECVRLALVLLLVVQIFDSLRDSRHRQIIVNALRASGFAVAVLALAQYAGFGSTVWPTFSSYPQRAYSVFANQDLLGGFLAITLPLTIGREKRTRFEIAISSVEIFVIVVVLLLSGCRGAWFAAFAGCALCLPKGTSSRKWLMTIVVIVCAGLLAAIFAPQATLGRFMNTFASADQGRDLRTWFFSGAWEMFLKNPIIGVGLGNYAYWSPYFQGAVLQSAGPGVYMHNAVHTVHAHNDYLEFLAETGLIGLAFIVWMVVRVTRFFERGAFGGACVAFAIFALSGFPVHSTMHLLFGLLCAACLLAERGFEPEPTRETSLIQKRTNTFGFAAISLAVVLFHGTAVVYPSFLLRQADKAALAGQNSLPLYEKAAEIGWPDAHMRFRFALALRRTGNDTAALEQLWYAGNGLDTAEFYRTLGAVNLKSGNIVPARESFQASLWRAPSDTESYVGLLHSIRPHEIPRALQLAEQWLDKSDYEHVSQVADSIIH